MQIMTGHTYTMYYPFHNFISSDCMGGDSASHHHSQNTTCHFLGGGEGPQVKCPQPFPSSTHCRMLKQIRTGHLDWYGHLLSLSSVLTPRVKGGDSESLSQNIPSHILGDGEGPYWD